VLLTGVKFAYLFSSPEISRISKRRYILHSWLLKITMLAVLPSSIAFCDIIYSNDFQGAVGTEWTNPSTDITPIGARRFLGQFSNDMVTLNLGSIDDHSLITAEFDLFIIRSWDGNTNYNGWGPDYWSLTADGATLLNTTFSHGPNQAFPGTAGIDEYPAMTGAVEVNTLGYTWGDQLNSVYHLTFSFAHSSPTLSLTFAGSNLQGVGDEAWGLDNVSVSSVSTASVPEPGLLTMLGIGFLCLGGLLAIRKRK
jgi:hypothetical protein